MKNLKSLLIIMAVMVISQTGMGNFAVSALSPVGQGQSIGNGLLSNDFQKLKEFQDILYLEPVDQEKLTKKIEELRTLCSTKEIDKELVMAMSLNYQRIPVLIPFLSKREVSARTLPHCDQDFLTILLKNGIDITDLEDILKLNRHVGFKRYLEELVMEMEKKGIEFDKSKVVIRKKSEIEKVIEEDDVESLRLLSNQANFDLNQTIKKENLQFGYYCEIPIISFCIEKHAIKCFKFLLLNGSDPLKKTDEMHYLRESNMDGMDFGAGIGNLQIMEMIEEKGGKIGTYAGKCAARFHQNHVLKWILQNPNSLENNFNWREVFIEAIMFDNMEGTNLILEQELIKDVNAMGNFYGMPLHAAAKNDAVGIAKWLISKGVNIDATDYVGRTPLHCAAERNASEVAELLIKAGAKIDAKNFPSVTPLYIAVYSKCSEVEELLISNGANINAKDFLGGTLLHNAALVDNIKMGKLMMSKGTDVNAKDETGRTPLHNAVDCRSKNMVVFLISQGADINAKDKAGQTPLSMAIGRDDSEIVELLISQGVEAKDTLGRSLLHEAVRCNSNRVVELLISKGANINAKDNEGETPLHVAVNNILYDSSNIVELLISKGADINAEDNEGKTPLHIAAVGRFKKIGELLISNGADTNAKDNEGKTPLHYFASRNRLFTKIVRFLISKGADINAKDNAGKTPLSYAEKKEMKKLLISMGAHE